MACSHSTFLVPSSTQVDDLVPKIGGKAGSDRDPREKLVEEALTDLWI